MIPEQKDYFPAVEEFLRSLANMNVRGLAMVALVKDRGVHDAVTAWGCGPFELAEAQRSCSSVLRNCTQNQ